MGLSLQKLQEIKQKAEGKNVVVSASGGDFLSGKLTVVENDYIVVSSKEETGFLSITDIKAIRIRE